MSATNEFGFDHVYDLARNLSPEDRQRLVRELTEPEKEIELVEITVSTGNPIFTPEDFARYEKNRERLLASVDLEQAKKNHEELGQLLRECPIATEGEIEMQNEIRRSMEQWQT